MLFVGYSVITVVIVKIYLDELHFQEHQLPSMKLVKETVASWHTVDSNLTCSSDIM